MARRGSCDSPSILMFGRVTTESLARWIASDSLRRPLLLDTRLTEEFAVSHLQGAVRIDPDAEDFAMLDTLSSDAGGR